MSAQKDHVNDVRATSYDAATARPAGYQGTIDDALAQIRAESEPARPYWPLNISRERFALLGFLGLNRSVRSMSGLRQPVNGTDVTRYELNKLAASFVPEDDSVEYGVPESRDEPGFFTLAYAMKHWPENFRSE